MSPPGGSIEPDHLSAEFSSAPPEGVQTGGLERLIQPGNLATAVEQVERNLISSTLGHTGGNISETARILGLTRRGLYLKMRRLGLDGVAADT
jgi:DNA-binding NtrC family response regulator